MTLSVPDSPGVPAAVASLTLSAAFNDLPSVSALLGRNRGEVAAIIVEPVVGNMGCVPPEPGFLEGLRRLATEEGALLIFDEVMTGFRLAPGEHRNGTGEARPDDARKDHRRGTPRGAYGGKREIMAMVAPSGPVYQAGTLSGNPLAMNAGFETLTILAEDRVCMSRSKGNRDAWPRGWCMPYSRSGSPSR